jgi:hypothetical protein
MEWIAWVTFGPPCDDPTEHWVNEEIDDGPEIKEPKRKPNGRVDMRKKENETKSLSKVQVESNALRTESVLLHQHDAYMAQRSEDVKSIMLFNQLSKTPAAIVSIVVSILYVT